MELEGRRVLVVGLGLSGLAASRLLLRRGAEVWATDRRPAGEFSPQVRDIEAQGVKLFLGGHPEEIFRAAQLIVVSPGVPLTLSPLTAARSRGVEIIGEMALAAALLECPLVAVTGTNGKSTTTALVAHLLRAAGKKVFLGGNIGRPLTELLLDEPDAELAVVEVSSFQLETMPFFRPRVAVIVNVSPDHLDRHPSLSAYADLKARIFADQTADDDLVLNAGDEISLGLASRAKSRVHLFSQGRLDAPGAAMSGHKALLWSAGDRRAEVEVDSFGLPGGHNRENLLAALLAAFLAGADPAALAAAVGSFTALPHRLQWVARKKGVDYYNDSKATNVNSAQVGVAGFERPVVLIAGGLDKGGGYRELAEAARGRVKAAVLIGQAAGLIAEALAGVCPIHFSPDLIAAVRLAAGLAGPGEVVLLSPACASFDQFRNYGHRGDVFAQAARELPDA